MPSASTFRPCTLAIFAFFLVAGCGSPPATEPARAALAPLGAASPPPLPVAAPAEREPAVERGASERGASERGASERVAAVFGQHCRSCHVEGTRLSNRQAIAALDMQRYPFTGGPAHEVGGKVLLAVGLGAKERTMPPEGWAALAPADLALIAEWAGSPSAAKEP